MPKIVVKIAKHFTLSFNLSFVINFSSLILSIFLYTGIFAVEFPNLFSMVVGLPFCYFIEKNYLHAFHFIYDMEVMHFVVAVIAFAFGFYVKYQLGKKYLFVSDSSKVLQC